jgi:hypothetical protein
MAKRQSIIEQFMKFVSPEPNSGCWLWTGAAGGNGYGFYKAKGIGMVAHRWAYTLLRGPIPTGLELDHLCRVRYCVNPAHLEPVTRSENARRGMTGRDPGAAERLRNGIEAIRRKWAAVAHCSRGHAFDEINTLWRGKDKRQRDCKECAKLRQHEFHARKRRAAISEPSGPLLLIP